MKKVFAVLGSILLVAGVKAQTSHAAKKETVQPAANKSTTGLPPANTLDKHKGEAPAFVKASTTVSPALKPTVVAPPTKKRNQ